MLPNDVVIYCVLFVYCFMKLLLLFFLFCCCAAFWNCCAAFWSCCAAFRNCCAVFLNCCAAFRSCCAAFRSCCCSGCSAVGVFCDALPLLHPPCLGSLQGNILRSKTNKKEFNKNVFNNCNTPLHICKNHSWFSLKTDMYVCTILALKVYFLCGKIIKDFSS